jgi:general secretion pathway protein K
MADARRERARSESRANKLESESEYPSQSELQSKSSEPTRGIADTMKIDFAIRRGQGIALIIVMIVIIVLGILAGGFAYSMKVETTLARRANFEPDLRWLGRSGAEMARYILAQQMTVPNEPYDSLNQKWAGGPGSVYSMENDVMSQVSLENNELGKGRFSIKIIALERKFNINLADQNILQQALFLIGVDPTSSSTIVDSILDWRDPDDDPHLSGTESDYYLRLDPPYVAKNAPIDDLTELLLIRGVTPDIYWSSQRSDLVGGGTPLTSFGIPGATQAGSHQVGLEDLFTPISGRLINVNTASAWVLQLVPGIDENIAQAIIRARSGPDGIDGTEDDIPFRSPQEIPMPGAGPQSAARLNSLFTVRSATFQVQVDAEIGSVKKQFIALLRRNSARDIQMLYMHEK